VQFDKDGRPKNIPMSWWMGKCTLGNGKQFFEDAEKIIKQLHDKAGFNNSPFFPASLASWSRTLEQEEN